MRILVVSNLFPPAVRGGYEVECARVVERLRAGHEVTVLTSDHPADAPTADEGVLRTLPWVEYSRRDSARAPLLAMRAADAARSALVDTRPDLVFAWNGAQVPHAALRVLLDADAPVAFRVCEHWFGRLFTGDVFMRHLQPGDRGARRAWAAAMRAVNRHPRLRLDPARRRRTAVSWASEALRAATPVPAALEPVLQRVIHAVPPHAEVFANVRRAPAHRVEIAYVGRVDERKGAPVAAEAVAVLRERHGIDAVLRLAGPADPDVAGRLRRDGAAVELLGPLPPAEVAALLARAHALVVPAVWEEPLGLTPVEGALAGVPVVASRVGGIPETLRDGEHALLVAPGDPAELADALARTLTEADETAARVRRAARRAREAFGLDGYLSASERFVADAATALG